MAELLLLLLLLLTAAVLLASSDLAADQRQCKDELMSLTPCLGFVSGEATSPTPQCCAVVAGRINTSLKCMCVLVKDRDEPGLGVRINPALALSLPTLCHSPSKASKCIELLGLSPTSKEAQVFVQFDNTTRPNSSGTTAPVVSSSGRWYVNTKCVAALINLVFALHMAGVAHS